MKYVILTFVVSLTFSGCSLMEKYPNDNWLEEAIEEVIKNRTGSDIDLSPFSPEEESDTQGKD